MNKKCLTALGEYFRQKIIKQLILYLAHDISHILRVANNARNITEHENTQWQVVLPAAWFHSSVCSIARPKCLFSRRSSDCNAQL